MYLRRHCYNKTWHCPGWAGGGWSSPYRVMKPDRLSDEEWEIYANRHRHWYQAKERCDGGSIWTLSRTDPLKWFRSHRCTKCDVRTIPYVTRWVDYTYWWFVFRYDVPNRIEDFKYDLEWAGWWKATKLYLKVFAFWRFWEPKQWFTDLRFRYSPLPAARRERAAEEQRLVEHYFRTK